MIIAIDPGPTQSAYVVMAGRKIIEHDKLDNFGMQVRLRGAYSDHYFDLMIEMIASYGMPVGAEVFETCVWIGRFIETCGDDRFRLIYRKEVKMHLCGSVRANDANIRQRLIDLYGGKEKAIGKKKTPGPLYGVTGDCWAALAVGVTAQNLASD